jgi:CRP-like cAMP-binding protein
VQIDAPKATIVRDGEDAENFYMILAGEAEVLKRDREGEQEFPLARLGPGDHFGEAALFRAAQRTATIRALSPMTLIMIKTREIRESPEDHGWLAPFLLNLVRENASRVDRLTKQTVTGLRAELDGTRRVLTLNRMLIAAILSLAVYAICLSLTGRLVASEFANTVISNGLYAGLGAVLIWVMLTSPYPLRFFGLHLPADWRRQVGESLVVTGVFLVSLTALKFALIRTVPALSGLALFEPLEHGFVELVYLVLYVIVLPIQELCVRGVLQSSLAEIFAGHRRRVMYSILLSNALFVAVHSYLSPYFAITLFVPGVMWGLLYVRHGSLLGVSISHVLIGVWALRLLGLGELMRML